MLDTAMYALPYASHFIWTLKSNMRQNKCILRNFLFYASIFVFFEVTIFKKYHFCLCCKNLCEIFIIATLNFKFKQYSYASDVQSTMLGALRTTRPNEAYTQWFLVLKELMVQCVKMTVERTREITKEWEVTWDRYH